MVALPKPAAPPQGEPETVEKKMSKAFKLGIYVAGAFVCFCCFDPCAPPSSLDRSIDLAGHVCAFDELRLIE